MKRIMCSMKLEGERWNKKVVVVSEVVSDVGDTTTSARFKLKMVQ